MSDGQNTPSRVEALDHTQRAMSSESQAEVVDDAVDRLAGSPAPDLDPMQTAMGKEAQIQVETEALSND